MLVVVGVGVMMVVLGVVGVLGGEEVIEEKLIFIVIIEEVLDDICVVVLKVICVLILLGLCEVKEFIIGLLKILNDLVLKEDVVEVKVKLEEVGVKV